MRASTGFKMLAACLFASFATVLAKSSDVDIDIKDHSRGPGPLDGWINGLKIKVPAMDMDTAVGVMNIHSGECWNATLDKLFSNDVSDGLVLGYEVGIAGMGVECNLTASKDGEDFFFYLRINDSSLNTTVEITPTYSQEQPDLPLPLGTFIVPTCNSSIKIENIIVTGNATKGSFVELVTVIVPMKDVISGFGNHMNELFCETFKDLVEVNGTQQLQTGAAVLGGFLTAPEPLPAPEPLLPLVNWSTSPPILVVSALLRERFSVWARQVVQILHMNPGAIKLADEEQYSISLHSLGGEGVVDEHSPGLYLTGDNADIDMFANFSGLVLRGTFLVQVHLPDQPQLQEIINVTIGLNNLTLDMQVYMKKGVMTSTDVADILHSPRCLIHCATPTTDPSNQSIAVKNLAASLRPVLGMTAWGPLEQDISAAVNTIVSSLYKSYFPFVNKLLNGGLGIARDPLNKALWKIFDRMEPCTKADLLLGISPTVIEGIFVAAFVVTGLGIVAGAAAQLIKGGKRNSEEEGSAEARQPRVATHEDGSLASEPFVPWFLKVFYPFALLAITLFFIYADIDLGATVSLRMQAGDETSVIGPLFGFSLVGTAYHSWTSGAHLICILTLGASGIWPLVKLTMLAFAWMAPSKVLSHRRRGWMLHFLDIGGKYSFLDSWFVVVTLSAFALEWQVVGEAAMKVETTPLRAFYIFFAATALSLVMGHIASESHIHAAKHRHRLSSISKPDAVAAAHADCSQTQNSMGESEPGSAAPRPTTSTASHGSEESDSSDSTEWVASEASDGSHADLSPLCNFGASWKSRIALPAALAASMVLVLASVGVVSFSFELSGIFVDFLLGGNVNDPYSLASIGLAVTTGRKGSVGLMVLEIVYIFLAIVLPVLSLILLLALWLLPMKLRTQEALLRVCYLCESWTSFDVAVLVVVIGALEFGQLSDFLIYKGDMAGPCLFIKNLTSDECVKVELSGHSTLALVVIAGLGSMVVPKVALTLSSRSIFRKFRETHVKSASKKGFPEVSDNENEVSVSM